MATENMELKPELPNLFKCFSVIDEILIPVIVGTTFLLLFNLFSLVTLEESYDAVLFVLGAALQGSLFCLVMRTIAYDPFRYFGKAVDKSEKAKKQEVWSEKLAFMFFVSLFFLLFKANADMRLIIMLMFIPVIFFNLTCLYLYFLYRAFVKKLTSLK